MNPKEFEAQFKARQIPDELQKPIGIGCSKCADCGFVWINCEGASVWAYCRCYHGKQKAISEFWKLPIYDYEMERIFKFKPFPFSAFIPSKFDSFKNGLENKMSLFKKDLRLSELFWAQGKI